VESKILVMQSVVKGTTKMSTLDIIKKTISEAEGGGTSVEGKKSLENQKKRAQIILKSADLRMKQQKEREALARQKSAVKEEVEELDELSTKKLSDYSDKASDDVHRLDKEGNAKKANKRFDGVVRASDKMTDNGKKLRGTPMKEEEKKMKGEDPCWDTHQMVGMKKGKGGKPVPNCVPKEGVKEETIAESGGVKVFKTDAGHIEKYGENNFAVYLDGKKQKAYDSLEAAKKALASGKEDLDEASKYQIYHPSYSSAVQHALSQAEKQGFTVDMDDYTQKVAFGPKKPSAGKTNSFSITLMDKNGKISKKKLQMQVYGMEGGKYELNMYTEEAEHITELSKKTLSSYVDKAIERAREMPGTGTNAEASKKTKRYAAVANAAYRTQGLAPRKGTDMFKKYKAEGVDVNEAENKPKKSYKDMKKKLENTSDKDIKAGEKLSGKQEPIDLSPTIDNNR
jgi:hypothetical protein